MRCQSCLLRSCNRFSTPRHGRIPILGLAQEAWPTALSHAEASYVPSLLNIGHPNGWPCQEESLILLWPRLHARSLSPPAPSQRSHAGVEYLLACTSASFPDGQERPVGPARLMPTSGMRPVMRRFGLSRRRCVDAGPGLAMPAADAARQPRT